MTCVAVVGTGRMGSAMARALAGAGIRLVLHNRTAARAEALAANLGAEMAPTPAVAASMADVCLTMLADEAAVRAAWTGAGGLLEGARPGTVLADMSTVAPSVIRDFAARAAAAGAGVVDAPVSGSVALAESGQLTIMAGGAAEAVERARPVFGILARRVFHVGPLGSGAAMKLAVNAVIFALNNAVSEGLVLAERAGIDRALAYDVLAESAAGAPFVAYKRQSFLDPDGSPVGFSLDLAIKDLRLIAELARSLDVPTRQAVTNLELIEAAASSVGDEADFSAVAAYLRRAAKEGSPTDLSARRVPSSSAIGGRSEAQKGIEP